ncbi:hypothetical protein [Clostridium sardiniense]|uniref:hypothetical protein n=1 Tax=Clostridium sardiniense TaxID=29369 RepID=UPI003D332F21
MRNEYKNIFSCNPDFKKNARMNWRFSKLIVEEKNRINMAEGYGGAAILLIDKCLEDNYDKKADIIIFPIIFSINQSIELYLKSIMSSVNKLLSHSETPKLNHDIISIFYYVDSKVKILEKDRYETCIFKRDYKNIEEYLKELREILNDKERKSMDFSRYPESVKGDTRFYEKTFDTILIDLENLKNRITTILENLNLIAWYYWELTQDQR